MSLATSYTSRIRLLVGDTDLEYSFLEDSVYEYLYFENGQNELDTAIAALENIINYIALNPSSETLGAVSGAGVTVLVLERRLDGLKGRKLKDASGSKRIPIMIRSDRKDWSDINKLFNKE